MIAGSSEDSELIPIYSQMRKRHLTELPQKMYSYNSTRLPIGMLPAILPILFDIPARTKKEDSSQ